MEVSESNKIMFYVCRLAGFAPYTYERDSKGRIINFKRNLVWCIYSILMFTVIVIFIVKGIINDSNSVKPVRMKTPTSKAVTSMDICVVVTACFFGTMSGLFDIKETRELNDRINEVDIILSNQAASQRDKRRNILALLVTILSTTAVMAFDIYSRLRMANKSKNQDGYVNVQGYIPFYFLYYILFLIQLNFTLTSLGLSHRYHRLNYLLRISILNNFINKPHSDGNNEPTVTVKEISHAVDNLGQTNNSSEKPETRFTGGNTIFATTMVVTSLKVNKIIDDLSLAHESLTKAIENISKSRGLTLLALLVSCLLHLVATSYFFLVEILGEKDPYVTYLQLIWLAVHTLRLLLIVEPCHLTYQEAKKTVMIVCEIQRKVKDQYVQSSITNFWKQLLIQEPFFSPLGMCNIDRQIITSFSGAIVTYLIILMQFQKSDGQS